MIGLAALVSLVMATLSVPVAFMLWMGVSVAVGRGDPTWNDGEEVWGTGFGLVLSAVLAFVYYVVAGDLSRRLGRGAGVVASGVLVVPVFVVNVVVAIAMLGGG